MSKFSQLSGHPIEDSRRGPAPRSDGFIITLLRFVNAHRQPRKVIGLLLILAIYAVKRLRVRDELIISPCRLQDPYSLWKLCRLAGIRTIPEQRRRAASTEHLLGCICHDDDTWSVASPGYLNGLCTDISKSHVDAIFKKAFGYGTKLDPMTCEGRAVMKAEANFSGGGVFVTLPIKAAKLRPDYIYQRLVDNETSPGVVTEFRVAVICGEITDVIVQRRSIDNRLTGRGRGGGLGSMICRPEEIFSTHEIASIVMFCAMLNMDFGELDVLPDVNEGRIYILDANKTPSCMVRASAFTLERFRLIQHRSEAFRRLVRERARISSGDVNAAKAGGAFDRNITNLRALRSTDG